MPEMSNTIPVIDCSKILEPLEEIEDSEEFKSFVKEVGDGMSTVGFLYFVNHGIPSEKVTTALERSKELFGLPGEVKEKYRKTNAVENFWGWTAPEDEVTNEKEKTPDSKEAFDFWGADTFNVSAYPKEVPGLGDAIIDFRTSFKSLTMKTLRAFAVYLQLDDKDYFIKKHRAFFEDEVIKSHNDVRSNFYLEVDSGVEIPEDSLRLGEHNDWGTITFLHQDDVGGLEAKLVDGTWIPVPPIPGSFVLNAGIMLEMWSAGVFPATAHRVKVLKGPNKERQSLGFFLQPDGDAVCLPLVAAKPEWNPLYPRVKGEIHYEYFQDRVRGSRASASAY